LLNPKVISLPCREDAELLGFFTTFSVLTYQCNQYDSTLFNVIILCPIKRTVYDLHNEKLSKFIRKQMKREPMGVAANISYLHLDI